MVPFFPLFDINLELYTTTVGHVILLEKKAELLNSLFSIVV